MNTGSTDFLKVLLALKTNIFRDLHVADIAKATGRNADGSWTCTTLSNNSTIIAYPLESLAIAAGDLVCILFCDMTFADNVKLVTSGKLPKKVDDDNALHQMSTGVIIGRIWIN